MDPLAIKEIFVCSNFQKSIKAIFHDNSIHYLSANVRRFQCDAKGFTEKITRLD